MVRGASSRGAHIITAIVTVTWETIDSALSYYDGHILCGGRSARGSFLLPAYLGCVDVDDRNMTPVLEIDERSFMKQWISVGRYYLHRGYFYITAHAVQTAETLHWDNYATGFIGAYDGKNIYPLYRQQRKDKQQHEGNAYRERYNGNIVIP